MWPTWSILSQSMSVWRDMVLEAPMPFWLRESQDKGDMEHEQRRTRPP